MTLPDKTQIVYENLLRKFINTTGQILVAGDVVCIDSSSTGEVLNVVLPSLESDPTVAGVVLETSYINEPVYVVQFGKTDIKVYGAISIGDRIVTKAGSTLGIVDPGTNGAVVAIALEEYNGSGGYGVIACNVISPVGYGVGSMFSGINGIATINYVGAAFDDLVWKQPVLCFVNYVSNGAPALDGVQGEKLLDTAAAKVYIFDSSAWVPWPLSSTGLLNAGQRVLFNLDGSNAGIAEHDHDNKIYEAQLVLGSMVISAIVPDVTTTWIVFNKEIEEIYYYDNDAAAWKVIQSKNIVVETVRINPVDESSVSPVEGQFMQYVKTETVGMDTVSTHIARTYDPAVGGDGMVDFIIASYIH